MGPHREHELEQELVCSQMLGVAGAPQLPADLAEFARPVGQDQRAASILQGGVVIPLGLVESRAEKPPPG